jgi:hypothetical protein
MREDPPELLAVRELLLCPRIEYPTRAPSPSQPPALTLRSACRNPRSLVLNHNLCLALVAIVVSRG